MGRRCCVVTCRNATIDECDERVSFFRVPGDEAAFGKWQDAIGPTGSELSRTSAVCERHFRPDEIRRMAVHRDSFGNVVFQRPLTKCSLAKNAVPSIFDDDNSRPAAKRRKKRSIAKNPDETKAAITSTLQGDLAMSYGDIMLSFSGQSDAMQLDDQPEAQKSDSVVPNYVLTGLDTLYGDGFNFDKTPGEADLAKSIISIMFRPQDDIENVSTNKSFERADREVAVDTPKEVTIFVPESELEALNQAKPKRRRTRKEVEPNEGTIHYPLPESEVQRNIRTFDLIFFNSHKIKLPNPMWGYHKNGDNKNVIIFSKAKWFEDVLMPPNYEKQVVFHESDNIKIYINNKFSPLEVRRPGDMHEMELILKYVDEVVVCQGGPNINEFVVVHCAQKDHAVSRWRHKLCPIIVSSDETICKFCTTINKVHRYPKKKRLPFGRRRPAEEES